MTIPELSDEETKALWKVFRFNLREARRCESAKAFLAGSVMVGAALETILILMVDCYPDEALATGLVPFYKKQSKSPIDWNLAELLRVAKKANWLPNEGLDVESNWTGKRPKVGDYAEVVKKVRNFLHPGRYIKDYHPKRITSKILANQFNIVQSCREWLGHKNEEGLRKTIEEYERSKILSK